MDIPLQVINKRCAQYPNTNDVWNDHESIQDVCDRPYGVQLDNASHEGEDDEQYFVRSDDTGTKQVLCAALTIVGPAQNGGVCEQCQRNRDDRTSDYRDQTKCLECQDCGVSGEEFRMSNSGADQGVPVSAQMITVSQKVPVMETRDCLTGFLVLAEAATIGADPIPDSLEKSPLANP